MTTTTNDQASPQQLSLLNALVARAVGDPTALLAECDQDFEGMLRTVDWFDDYHGTKSVALLAHCLKTRQHRDFVRSSSQPSSSFWTTGWHDLVDELKAEGFSDREAPLAASAVMVRPRQPRGDALKAHLHRQYPWLADEGPHLLETA